MSLKERLYYLRFQVNKLRKEKKELWEQILKLKKTILTQQEVIEGQMFRIVKLKKGEGKWERRMPDIIKEKYHKRRQKC